MFRARLETGRSSLEYFEKFRVVLYGRDLYQECTTREMTADPQWRADDWRREQLLYSLHLHQVFLARLKPALHDYVTFYLPRLILQRESQLAAVTAEDAATEFSTRSTSADRGMPLQMLEEYRNRDLDYMLNAMDRSAFADAWPLLARGLHVETAQA